jgi:hypothetical protein
MLPRNLLPAAHAGSKKAYSRKNQPSNGGPFPQALLLCFRHCESDVVRTWRDLHPQDITGLG